LLHSVAQCMPMHPQTCWKSALPAMFWVLHIIRHVLSVHMLVAMQVLSASQSGFARQVVATSQQLCWTQALHDGLPTFQS
jgi:hypothetical protein